MLFRVGIMLSCYRFSWERIRDLCHLRRKYVQLYASSLRKIDVDIYEMRKIEKDLDSKVILLWRLLAHAKVESVKSKEAAQQQAGLKGSWLSFRWLTSSQDVSITNDLVGEKLVDEKRLSKEEWESLNKLLSYHIDEDANPLLGKDVQSIVQLLIDVSISQAAARIISINLTEILYVSKSVHCDLSLKFYGLSAPEGSLVQSVSNERKANALAATFVHLPALENVDWQLSATIAPCHVTVLMKSYERFLEFIKRSNAVSPAVALETATALQMKIEQVTRRAQEQFQMVLEEKNRFALDIDFDAPKVRVPLKGTGLPSTEDFFLDFGHFTLHTRECEREEQRKSLYSRFYVSVRDIAAFFMDVNSGSTTSSVAQKTVDEKSHPFPKDHREVYSLIDRCGMSVVVDMIKIAHPRYPSTRVSMQVPSLDIHFSPARYCRLIDLLDMFNGSWGTNDLITNGHSDSSSVPWYPADLITNARVLVWRGIGNSLAEWQPCFIVLCGLYLYVLESETSQNYQRCVSMGGRQVFEVSPSSVGGSLLSIAVGCRGTDVQKALESSTTMIIEFQGDDEKAVWLKELVQATYRASAPPAIDIFGEAIHKEGESSGTPTCNQGNADLVINGALLETSLSIYGKLDRSKDANEEIILELLAAGGKVNVVRSEADLTVKMKLHSLKVKDELQGRLSSPPQFLACSVLKDNMDSPRLSSLHLNDRVFCNFFFDKDDIFYGRITRFLGDVWSVLDSNEFSSQEKERTKWKTATEVFYEAQDDVTTDFIAVTFLTRNPDSPHYDGIDTQMTICMSKLDFFCNRPTLVALIEFGLDLSLVNSGANIGDGINVSEAASSQGTEKPEESGFSIVKGLLGHGKGRVVFNLTMDIDSVSIYLNNEDGSQLAMFVQECFLLNIKVHPNSLYMDGTLGNLRLCDLSLGPDHSWGWLCDLRNQGVESLIKTSGWFDCRSVRVTRLCLVICCVLMEFEAFSINQFLRKVLKLLPMFPLFTFQSYSVADDDYKGYDYSLHGQLSAVRIIFLYRFVQEITSYFMELGTPRTEEAIKLVDKVGDFEWLIQNFLQLDLGQLHLSNGFSWHGCQDEDPSAVHIDVLDIEVSGINMAVGINGLLGMPMIREEEGFNIHIRRSLRDVFRRVPTVYVDVRVGLLHCIMSDKEYNVILDCVYMNISEEPRLPPSFRDAPKDSMRIIADKVQLNSQILLSRTIAIISLEIHTALLDLRNGLDEESQLAHIALEGLWLSYRTTSLFETDIYLTIPKLSILDIRHDTKPEMRLMLGSSSDVSRQGICSYHSKMWSSNDVSNRCIGPVADAETPILTMLIMDYHQRSSSQSLVIRIQQPRILVVLDFLLPVVEFFVPALGVVTGREEMMHPENDPLTKCEDIILLESIYLQQSNVVYLSPQRRLIVDGCGIDEFIYDGCGGAIHLITDSELKNKFPGTLPIIILIGRGKNCGLRMSNLRSCTYLGNDSSYSVSADDGVEISVVHSNSATDEESLIEFKKGSPKSADPTTGERTTSNQMKSTSFEIQVPSFLLLLQKDGWFYLIKSNSDLIKNILLVEKGFEETFIPAISHPLFRKQGKRTLLDGPILSHGVVASASIIGLVLFMQVVSPEFTFYDSTKLFMDDSLLVEKLLRAKLDLNFMLCSLALCTFHAPISFNCNYHIFVIAEQKTIFISQRAKLISSFTSLTSIFFSLMLDTMITFPRFACWKLLIVTPCKQDLTVEAGSGLMVLDPVDISGGYSSTKDKTNISIISSDIFIHLSLSVASLLLQLENQAMEALQFGNANPLATCSNYKQLWVSKRGNTSTYNLTFWRPRLRQTLSSLVIVPVPPSQVVMAVSNTYGRVKKPVGFKLICSLSHLLRMEGECSTDANNECFLWMPSAPPNNVVYCIRSDLMSSTTFSDCIFSVLPNQSGLPSKSKLFRFASTLLSYSNMRIAMKSISKDSLGHGKEENNCSYRSSGWDIVRSLSKSSSEFGRPVSIWRPLPRPSFSALGDCIVEGLEPPAFGLLFKCDKSELSARPVQFAKVAHIIRKGLMKHSFGTRLTDELPNKELFCCPRMDIVKQTNIAEIPISRSSSSKGSNCLSIWKVENQACTFHASSDLKKPSNRLAYSIEDSVKPKTRENISVEMKLGCFSLTLLDNLYRMLTPLLDMTITNINLATHGRLDSISAALVCSIAASTFNRQLEAWEPLVEPFDGIFKVETFNMNEQSPPRFGKRLRVSTTTPVNVNASAANLESMTESIMSWRRQMVLEQKSCQKNEEPDLHSSSINGLMFSALEEDDLQRVIVENKLGCGVYLRKLEKSPETSELLQHDEQVSVTIPPPRFSNQLNSADASRETRYYVAIRIFEAKGLPIQDDGNAHDFFCALRLIFPQSARTRVRRVVSQENDETEGLVKWNEVFIFEVPEKVMKHLCPYFFGYTGEMIGALSIPIGNGVNILQRVASIRMLQHSDVIQKSSSYPLRSKVHLSSFCVSLCNGGSMDCGSLLLSTAFFERNNNVNFQGERRNTVTSDRDTGFCIGLDPNGPWECFGSLLPVAVVPRSINKKNFAFEVFIKNGRKHAILRPLAVVVNDTNIKMEDFFEPPLLPGWRWTSTWTIEKSPFGDSDGWAYGPDFQSLKWPPRSPKSSSRTSLDFFRRRRWVRERQKIEDTEDMRNVFGVLIPGSSAILPWSSMQYDSELCLQVRPCAEYPGDEYRWVILNPLSRQSSTRYRNAPLTCSGLKLGQLEKKDIIMCCHASSSSRQNFWLSVGTDASVLHTDLNSPIYDWKISINAPLKLENKLPCNADFAIWEKTVAGSLVERHRGVLLPSGSETIYSADLRRPIYLTLFLQDAILIVDMFTLQHSSSFFIIHQQSRRKLRVNIERDMGGTDAATKIVRFFVPYWISNDTSLQLVYQVVEIEPLGNVQSESVPMTKTVKSAKLPLKHNSKMIDAHIPTPRKDSQILELIVDSGESFVMLSPQDYMGRSGILPFSSRNDPSLSPRVGIAVAVHDSEYFSTGVSLTELENKGRIDIKAFTTNKAYYKLSALLTMASDRTKVVHFQHKILFVNRIGQRVSLKQFNSESEEWFHPSDPPKIFKWHSTSHTELLMLHIDGYKWSSPFSVESEGVMCVILKNDLGNEQMNLRVEVRTGTQGSSFEVIFRLGSTFSSPYRIENRSMFLPLRIRQVDGSEDSWSSLPPNTAISFYWEDLGRQRLLEVLVDGSDPSNSEKFSIDKVIDHQPLQISSGRVRPLRLSIVKEGKIFVCKISDWMPDDEETIITHGSAPLTLSYSSENDYSNESSSERELHVILELADIGLSIIDHTPEEILYVSIQFLLLSYSTGSGSGISRLKLQMRGIQVDNQLPFTPMPVLLRMQRVEDHINYILKFSLTKQASGSLDLCIYPYLGVQGPENSAFLVNIHEPIIWRLHEMFQQSKFSSIYGSETGDVPVDPIVQIGLLNISEVRFRVSMAMSPAQRPRGVLGFWSSLMTALGNTEHMPVKKRMNRPQDSTRMRLFPPPKPWMHQRFVFKIPNKRFSHTGQNQAWERQLLACDASGSFHG
ncbi:unnamed protein product [Spirodela intermedia]|uniref:Peroxin/Ferlin domain-containing protein n=1 Tax=Spirodela intermedia TaxID=51605 RepID=A0A7I8IQE7_SPIIN|nr:unnamed protein product [Spirodela intermedia]CAA6659805.1 unnamed protein product [Spirodela intermedia]